MSSRKLVHRRLLIVKSSIEKCSMQDTIRDTDIENEKKICNEKLHKDTKNWLRLQQIASCCLQGRIEGWDTQQVKRDLTLRKTCKGYNSFFHKQNGYPWPFFSDSRATVVLSSPLDPILYAKRKKNVQDFFKCTL